MAKTIQLDRTPSLPLDCGPELVPIGESTGGIGDRADAPELSTRLSRQLDGQYREIGRNVSERNAIAQGIHHPDGLDILEIKTEEKSELFPAQHRVLVNTFLAKLALGESVQESKRVSSIIGHNSSKDHSINLQNFSARLKLFVRPIKRYNQEWLNEILGVAAQLEQPQRRRNQYSRWQIFGRIFSTGK